MGWVSVVKFQGVLVATVAINNAANAGLLAVRMMGIRDADLLARQVIYNRDGALPCSSLAHMESKERGSVFSDLNCSGVGAIIRNHAGEVMASMSAKGEYVHNTDEVEALACRKALEFAMEAGFSNLFVALSCVKREGNMVAHSLARFARNIVDDMYWMEDEPPPAVDGFHYDRLHINE
ncbi:hypothetical protein SO802_028839 [Lithocarpus litseifolius]|uniref:RNase H type-1 domain-containing protein n=1 Tax=Lithocarpus litseifolius TaxID=425828 RepID=A0AAW2BUL9_9ROSI